MSEHAFRIHTVVCSNALPYFQDLVRNARELASRDAKIAVVAHCTDADMPLSAPFYAAIESHLQGLSAPASRGPGAA